MHIHKGHKKLLLTFNYFYVQSRMSECRPRALWWKRQMDDGHELLCCHLLLLQLISFSSKESHGFINPWPRKKPTTVTRQQKKSRDLFQNYCIFVTSISADLKLHVKLVIFQTSRAAIYMIFQILQSCVSRYRNFSLLDPVPEFSKLDPKPMTLWIISCSKTHVQFYYSSLLVMEYYVC